MTDNIDVGQLSEAINDKMDRDANNAEDALRADYVIDYQAPTSENNYTWYRLYRSGWVEQGGSSMLASGVAPVTFPIEFSDTNYTAFAISAQTGTGFYQSNNANVINKTTTTMDIRCYTNTNYPFDWEAKGMSAQS